MRARAPDPMAVLPPADDGSALSSDTRVMASMVTSGLATDAELLKTTAPTSSSSLAYDVMYLLLAWRRPRVHSGYHVVCVGWGEATTPGPAASQRLCDLQPPLESSGTHLPLHPSATHSGTHCPCDPWTPPPLQTVPPPWTPPHPTGLLTPVNSPHTHPSPPRVQPSPTPNSSPSWTHTLQPAPPQSLPTNPLPTPGPAAPCVQPSPPGPPTEAAPV